MEGRKLANASINYISFFGSIHGIDICLHGCQHIRGRIRKGSQNGLAPNDHQIAAARETAAGSYNMFKLFSIHGCMPEADPPPAVAKLSMAGKPAEKRR